MNVESLRKKPRSTVINTDYSPRSLEWDLAMGRFIREGTEEQKGQAIEALVHSHFPYMLSKVRGLHTSDPAIDIDSLAIFATVDAARRYDHNRGVPFIAYARHYLTKHVFPQIIRGGSLNAPIGRGLWKTLKTVDAYVRTNHVTPAKAISDVMPTFDEKKALELEQLYFRRFRSMPTPLGAPVGEGNKRTYQELVASPSKTDAFDQLLTQERRQELFAAIDNLKARQRYVVLRYFGMPLQLSEPETAQEPQTLQAIGDELGITREGVRQIKEAALKKLREEIARKHLLEDPV